MTFFDGAWSYGPETADQLMGEALEGYDVVLATKGGVDKVGPGQITVDGSRDALHRQIEKSLGNLRREQIDLYQLHRVDPETPIEVSMEALAEAQSNGWIRHIGLSNVTRAEVERALEVAPVAAVQNRYSPADAPDEEMERMIDWLRDLGIAFVPHGPLGANPMRQGAAVDPGEALRSLLARSPNILAIPGTTSIKHLESNASALLN